jgi:hypothetical protein
MAKQKVVVKLKDHKLSISHMRPRAFLKRNDEVWWVCEDASMDVAFDYPGQPSPLAQTSLHIPKGKIGAGAVGVTAATVPYTLKINHPQYTVVIDPEVLIDGGDPGKGARKAAKKKAAKKKSARKSARRR